MQLLTDRTGRPGPSTWEAGDFPDGQEDFPVTGISWYEAAAFADFAGKEIPTENHWKSALGLDYIHSQVLTRSNFQYKGPVKVGLYKGIFAYGTFDMAGNAREWCFNGKDNKQSLLGGAWDDPYYVYLAGALVPAFDRSVKNGFRCVKYIDKTKIPDRFFSSQSSNQTFDSNFWHRVRPVSDEVFRVIKNRFVYNKKDFKAKIEKKDKSPKDWSLELISFNTVYDNKRMVVYLYLPKNISSPFQTVIMYPGFDGFAGSSNDSYAERYSHNYDFIVKSGRALLLPVYYGNLERSKDAVPDSYPGQTVIYWITDFRRTIDYLETRPDIDTAKIAVMGASWGGIWTSIIPAIEERLKAAIMVVSGFAGCPTIEDMDKYKVSEFDQINFVKRVKIPVLMLSGKYDVFYSYEFTVRPMFELLGTPPSDKKLMVYETDHFVPYKDLVKETLDWLDKYLGPVNR